MLKIVDNKSIYFLNLTENQGKAQAVRKAALYINKSISSEWIAYWDADLATPLEEILHMYNCILNNNNLDMGAAWIHGSNQDNPLNKFVNTDSLIPVSTCNPWMHSENIKIKYLNNSHDITEETRQKLALKWNTIATKIGSIQNKTGIEFIKTGR